VIADDPAIVRGIRLYFTTMDIRGRVPRASKEVRGSTPLWRTEGCADVETDEQGRFAVPAIATGDLRIEYRVDEEQPLQPKLPGARVQTDKTTTIEIPMVPTVVVRGSIRAKDTGQPISGATMHIYYGVGGQGARAFSDAEGKFTARVLPGPIGLQVIHMPQEYVQLGEVGNRTIDVPQDAKEFELPPLEVVPAKSMTGRLIDGHDQPVAGARILLMEAGRTYGFGKSDDKGEFNLTGVPTTMNPTGANYKWWPEASSTGPSECEIVTTDPLVLRALDRLSPPYRAVK
jgi:hypothetical protein